jgi:uncharacterized protein (TIGR00369 family)
MRYLAGIMLLRLQGLVFLGLLLGVTMFSNVVGNLGVVPFVGRVAYLPAVVLAMASAGGLGLGLTKWGQTSATGLYEGLLLAAGIAFAIVDRPGGGQTPAFRDPAVIVHLILLPIAVALVTYWPVIFAIRRGGLAALNAPVMPEYKDDEPPPPPPELYVPQPREEIMGLPESRGTGAAALASPYAGEAIAVPHSTPGTPPMAPPPHPEPVVAGEVTGAIWQEDPPEVPMSMEWLKLPGMLRMRSQLSGGFPPASFARLTGIETVSLEPGEVRVEMPVSDWLCNSAGLVSPGVIGYLADSPMGSAVFTELGPGQVITTSEMAVNYLRPVSRDATKLLALAKLVHIGRSFAFTEVTITDDRDKLVGHATARNLLIEVSVPDGEFEAPPTQELKPGYVDPYLRPVRGEVLPPGIWTEKSGLEMQRMWLTGELPNSPLAELVGMRRTAVSEGSVTMAAPATPWLESPARRLYGGALALLADACLTSAVQTTVPAGTAIAPLDIKVQFLRPVRANGRDLTIKADVVHRGRTLAAASAEVRIPGGKVAALATSTWLIVPDFSWATDPWVPTDQVEVTEDEADN